MMRSPKERDLLLIAGALAANIVLQRYSTQDTESGSEAVCWTLLLFGSMFLNLCEVNSDHSGLYCWTAAVGIAIASVGKSLEDVRWITPLLSLGLYLARKFWNQPIPLFKEPSFAYDLHPLLFRLSGPVLSLLILLPTIHFSSQSLAAALAYLISFIGVLTAFQLMNDRPCHSSGGLEDSTTANMIKCVSVKALPLVVLSFVLLVAVSSITMTSNSGTIILLTGILKALQWGCLFSTTHDVPWDVVAPIHTFAAIVSLPASALVSYWSTIGYLLASLATLAETITIIPTSSRTKLLIFGFVVIPCFTAFSAANFSIKDLAYFSSNSTMMGKHPVEQLIEKFQADFSTVVDRQSKTLAQAKTEYQRRYSIDPPPGFEKWFEYAKSQNYILIDEFDSIYRSVSPYWKFPASTLRKNIKQAHRLDENVYHCRYEGGRFKGKCGWHGSDIKLIMSAVAHLLPDVEFLLSDADGPRVIISDDLEEASQDVRFENYHAKNAWKPLTAVCKNRNRTSSTESRFERANLGLPFVQDVQDSKDICKHPEYADQHSLFMSPADAKYTRQAVPILSQAKTSTNNDILIPSVYYFSTASGGAYNPNIDPPWSRKPDGRLYWAGSNTGGISHDGLWRNFQRQRFVNRTNHVENQDETYLADKSPSIWESHQTSEDLSLFDVKFTAYFQCKPQSECRKQEKAYGRHPRERRPKMYRHKLLADLDGNGYSGRWYSILRSQSTPFKQTVYHEWHDDRLYPWVHYIPMSLSYDEVPELARYFARTKKGQRHAREIAEASRDWFAEAFRWEDFQVYFWRVLLEYARLLDEKREVIN